MSCANEDAILTATVADPTTSGNLRAVKLASIALGICNQIASKNKLIDSHTATSAQIAEIDQEITKLRHERAILMLQNASIPFTDPTTLAAFRTSVAQLAQLNQNSTNADAFLSACVDVTAKAQAIA